MRREVEEEKAYHRDPIREEEGGATLKGET